LKFTITTQHNNTMIKLQLLHLQTTI
jgi:hypothetical protein